MILNNNDDADYDLKNKIYKEKEINNELNNIDNIKNENKKSLYRKLRIIRILYSRIKYRFNKFY